MTHKTDIDLFLMPPTFMTYINLTLTFFNATDSYDPYESDTDLFFFLMPPTFMTYMNLTLTLFNATDRT